MEKPAKVLKNAESFVKFLNKSPTPFHVVESARTLLKNAGFLELKLSDSWSTSPNGKYFVTKNESTLIAFVIGGKYENGNGFAMVGAHTDSPCLKLKLVSKRTKHGYLQVGVECYGSGIWHTWFDRDLTVAGRVLVQRDGKVHHRLVHIDKPILRIPSLAIHFRKKDGINPENHLLPILATVVQDRLNAKKEKKLETKNNVSKQKSDKEAIPIKSSSHKDEQAISSKATEQVDKHHSILIDAICRELNCQPEEIVDLELQLVDHQPAVVGGLLDEFIFGARLDNQVSSYCAVKALIGNSDDPDDLASEKCVRMAALYDHEEVGSQSAVGAASSLTEHVMRRLSSSDTFALAASRSFFISADQAHAVHPNYSEVHEELHRPAINAGIVIKYNGNQRYATNSISASVVRQAARLADVPVQDYMVKNGCPCGTTIGPLVSSKLAVTTVDIGTPQLSMHSIRETTATINITHLIKLLVAFYRNYSHISLMFSDVVS